MRGPMPLIYLHGFNSSPQSQKASLLRRRMQVLGCEDELRVPKLPPSPAQAIAEASRLIEQSSRPADVCLLGSSLGGYYATWLAERYGTRAVLINPAVAPHRLFEDLLGPQRNLYTGEEYELTRTHLEQLAGLELAHVRHPERFLVLLQTGDEVLDYREAASKFAAADLRITEGGDHGFRGFDILLDELLEFCRACTSSGN